MFNLLIADDEELERKTIMTILKNNFPGTFEIYEAKNGREAIEIADKVKPEIIIMDIKMPGINGIAAMKEIRKFLKEVYFIILTAYDYFDYAKEAIEYDVKEYMLKPFKRSEFINKIGNAIKIIEETRRKRHEEIILREKIFTLIPMMENEICFSLMNNNISNIDYETYINYIGINFISAFAIIIRMDNHIEQNEKMNLKFKINDYVRECIKRQNNAISSCIFSDDIVIFVEINSENQDNIVRKLCNGIKNKFDISVSIGIGSICNGIEELSKSYTEALAALGRISVSDKHLKSVNYMGNQGVLQRGSSINQQNIDESRSIITKAIDYISKNFKKDLMLEEVAAVVDISSFYLSKIFKEYTGKNYVDYITDLRIAVAKQRLREGIVSIKEICYEVGYNDPNYFSRVFKKVEGVSPTEYKNKFGDKIK